MRPAVFFNGNIVILRAKLVFWGTAFTERKRLWNVDLLFLFRMVFLQEGFESVK